MSKATREKYEKMTLDELEVVRDTLQDSMPAVESEIFDEIIERKSEEYLTEERAAGRLFTLKEFLTMPPSPTWE